MSASARTDSKGHLALVSSSTSRARGREYVVLRPSARLTSFVAAAAAHGLDAPDAVRLAVQRSLALADAGVAGTDVDTARALLCAAAAAARPRHQLGPQQAAYVRRLTAPRRAKAVETSQGLNVALPERLMTRARHTVRPHAFRAGVVPDMVAWEIAATLEGRELNEWALYVLASARRH